MRCLNCYTVCLEREIRCLACGYQMAEPEQFVPTTTLAKWGCGIPLLLASVFLARLTLAAGYIGYEADRDGVRPFSAEELLSIKNPETLADPWVNYRFSKSLQTNIRKTVM